MSGTPRVEKAELRELDASFTREINPDRRVQVQFNPESLKVSSANQLVPGPNGDPAPGAPQFVGAGSTRLTVQLWFDVASHRDVPADDVRKLTERVAYFLKPRPHPHLRDILVPPVLRFVWGSFQFDGVVESLEESLEFFSPEGRPLRASLSLTVSQRKLGLPVRELPPGPPWAQLPGLTPRTPAPPGQSLQQLVAARGGGPSWQDVAAANDIENPRFVPPGQPLDLQPPTRR